MVQHGMLLVSSVPRRGLIDLTCICITQGIELTKMIPIQLNKWIVQFGCVCSVRKSGRCEAEVACSIEAKDAPDRTPSSCNTPLLCSSNTFSIQHK
ncbi:hypothetical protein GQ53DRAFT_517610 [Thozetella sp. PMI_491]|nr:hypothetical protein GQ53DRAFT_517610 [Thozetella sp. PMI_491]